MVNIIIESFNGIMSALGHYKQLEVVEMAKLFVGSFLKYHRDNFTWVKKTLA